MEKDLIYLAGLFDGRGHINCNLKQDYKGRTKFTVYFNFKSGNINLWEDVKQMLKRNGIESVKIYTAKRTKGKSKEQQININNRYDSAIFLMLIHPYSLRKKEIEKVLWELLRYETEIKKRRKNKNMIKLLKEFFGLMKTSYIRNEQ